MALLILHKDYGWHWVVFVFVFFLTADRGANFSGRRGGSRKLADQISPGKTWEGVAGALLMSSMVSLGYGLYQSMSLNLFMLLCLLTVVASILGDLLESLLCANVDIYSMNTKVFSTVTMWINQQLTLILKKVGGQ
jgi:phosphatidate cytidylyltransferase